MTDTQRSDAYWQIQDYEYFRGTAQIIANEVLKVTATQPPTSHSYNAVMTRVYDLCAVLSERDHQKQQQQRQKDQCRKDRKGEDESIAALDTTVPASCSSLSSTSSGNPSSPSSPSSSSDSEMMIPPHLFAALTHWIKAGHSRRGLERFCTSHVRTRPMAKAATIQAVLLAQDLLHKLEEERKQQQQKTSQSSPTKFQIGSNEFPLGSLSKEEVLRLVSERFSNTSRYFGTAMGHADAAAIGNYQHPLKN